MRKKIEKILNVVILACFLSVIVTTALGKTSVFGFRPMYVLTESMSPVIEAHQFVLGKAVNASEVEIGDIVAYQTPEKVIIHRIISINNDGTYEFLGDNNNGIQLEEDKAVKPDQILYKVILY